MHLTYEPNHTSVVVSDSKLRWLLMWPNQRTYNVCCRDCDWSVKIKGLKNAHHIADEVDKWGIWPTPEIITFFCQYCDQPFYAPYAQYDIFRLGNKRCTWSYRRQVVHTCWELNEVAQKIDESAMEQLREGLLKLAI